jgi:hypothetical protein
LRTIANVALLSTALAALSCSDQDAQLQQHKEKFESLTATTTAIGEAWLDQSASSTYARAALERTYLLLEQERAKLVGSPESLLDERGVHLAQDAELLSRTIASMIGDVKRADSHALRQRLSTLPRLTEGR